MTELSTKKLGSEFSAHQYSRDNEEHTHFFRDIPQGINEFSLFPLNSGDHYVTYKDGELQSFTISFITGEKEPSRLEASPTGKVVFSQIIDNALKPIDVVRFAVSCIHMTVVSGDCTIIHTLLTTKTVERTPRQKEINAYLHTNISGESSVVINSVGDQVELRFYNATRCFEKISFVWVDDKLVCQHKKGPFYFYPRSRVLDVVEYLKFAFIVVDAHHVRFYGTWDGFKNRIKK